MTVMQEHVNNAQAIKLIDRLLKIEHNDEGIAAILGQARARLSLPMWRVLAKVPGDTVVDKCEMIGISRQAYYDYLRGVSRPNEQQAKKLQSLTGFKAKDIRAGGHSAPRPS